MVEEDKVVVVEDASMAAEAPDEVVVDQHVNIMMAQAQEVATMTSVVMQK